MPLESNVRLVQAGKVIRQVKQKKIIGMLFFYTFESFKWPKNYALIPIYTVSFLFLPSPPIPI